MRRDLLNAGGLSANGMPHSRAVLRPFFPTSPAVAFLFCAWCLAWLAGPAIAGWQAIIPEDGSSPWKATAEAWLRSAGETNPCVFTAGQVLETVPKDGSVQWLVFGQPGTNPLMARWYARNLDSTDAIFPGDDGWALRWIPNTPEVGPALVVGGASPKALSAAQEAFVQMARGRSFRTRIQLAPSWSPTLEAERAWWKQMLALPSLGERAPNGRMTCSVDKNLSPLAQPEYAPWNLWILRMIELFNRTAEGSHATADAEAEKLCLRVAETMLAHLPPSEACDEMKNPKSWMWEYYWPVFISGLLSNQELVARDPEFLKRLCLAVFQTTDSSMKGSIYGEPLTNPKRDLGSRHELAEVYGIYLTTEFLLQTRALPRREMREVSKWRRYVDAYFAKASPAPLFDDNSINYNDISILATYWMGNGSQEPLKNGGLEWAANYLIGQTDNAGLAASWGYEYDGSNPVHANVALPLVKLAYFGHADHWLPWALRHTDLTKGVRDCFVLRETTPWLKVHCFAWNKEKSQAPLAAKTLQVLPLSPLRAKSVGVQNTETACHSITARMGTDPEDAHVVMMGYNGPWSQKNAVAGALVHFSSHGKYWLRGSLPESVLPTSHNRISLSGDAYADTPHAIEVTWQATSDDWAAWEIAEPRPNGPRWTRDAVLWKQGSLLVVDRVDSSSEGGAEWITTWLPSITPQRDECGWVMRRDGACARLLAGDSQEFHLESKGFTLDGQKLPSGPWVLRGLPNRGKGPLAERVSLWAVGKEDRFISRLERRENLWEVQLPEESYGWSIKVEGRGLTIQRIPITPGSSPQPAVVSTGPAPKTPPTVEATTPSDARPAWLEKLSSLWRRLTRNALDRPKPSGSGRSESSPAPGFPSALLRITGGTATRLLEAAKGDSLVCEERLWLLNNRDQSVVLPGKAIIHRVEVAIRGQSKADLQIAFSLGGVPVPLQASCHPDQIQKLNGWKGFAEDFLAGSGSPSSPVSADTLVLTPSTGGGYARVRVWGEASRPLTAMPWKSLRLWPQPDGSMRAACLDQASRVTVVNSEGAVLWRHAPRATDFLWIEPSRSGAPRLAVLSADQKVEVLDAKGDPLWTADLHELAPSDEGSIPFRAVWGDVNGDGTPDLIIGTFCFEAALDGRDGKLLGKSGFVPFFWPNALAVTPLAKGARVWTAPSVSSPVKFWDCPSGATGYTSGPGYSLGGKLIFFADVGTAENPRLVQVRERMAWSWTPPETAPAQKWEDNPVDWLWRAPNLLCAGAADAGGKGEVVVGDIAGNICKLNGGGPPDARTALPEAPSRILSLASAQGLRWWIVGSGGGAWLLDENLRTLLELRDPGGPWQEAAEFMSGSEAGWWLVARGRSVFLVRSPKPTPPATESPPR